MLAWNVRCSQQVQVQIRLDRGRLQRYAIQREILVHGASECIRDLRRSLRKLPYVSVWGPVVDALVHEHLEDT